MGNGVPTAGQGDAGLVDAAKIMLYAAKKAGSKFQIHPRDSWVDIGIAGWLLQTQC